MGAALVKGQNTNKVSTTNGQGQGDSTHRKRNGEQGRAIVVSQSASNIPTLPPIAQGRSAKPERDDAFLEDIANGVMERTHNRSFHNATYGGLDLRLEVDCVDVPAQEVCTSYLKILFIAFFGIFMHSCIM